VAEPTTVAACVAKYKSSPVAAAAWPDALAANGWRLMGSSDDFALFASELVTKSMFELPPDPPSGYRRRWFRYEYRTGQSGVRSRVELQEADCKKGVFRIVEGAEYSGNNMQGVGSTLTGTTWSHPVPGTTGETTFQDACAPTASDAFLKSFGEAPKP
jgi:hypothetical protein